MGTKVGRTSRDDDGAATRCAKNGEPQRSSDVVEGYARRWCKSTPVELDPRGRTVLPTASVRVRGVLHAGRRQRQSARPDPSAPLGRQPSLRVEVAAGSSRFRPETDRAACRAVARSPPACSHPTTKPQHSRRALRLARQNRVGAARGPSAQRTGDGTQCSCVKPQQQPRLRWRWRSRRRQPPVS